MMETGRHELCVTAWLATRFVRGDDEGELTTLLLAGLRALWERARPSLGEVTLTAIFQRAIRTAERRHRDLEQLGLRVSDRGAIEITSTSPPRVDLHDAVACVLVEVLRAISRVTADGLTQPLHAALASATSEEPRALVLLRPSVARCDGRHERGAP
jgi:hypothetical protein